MEAYAEIKYIKVSPKRMKAIGKAVVGLSPQEAMDRLSFLSNKGAGIMNKAIKSALANATNNVKLNAAALKIKTIIVLKGPVAKRWQPVSRGTAHQIKKKTTHVKVVLEEIRKTGKTAVKALPPEIKTEEKVQKVQKEKKENK